ECGPAASEPGPGGDAGRGAGRPRPPHAPGRVRAVRPAHGGPLCGGRPPLRLHLWADAHRLRLGPGSACRPPGPPRLCGAALQPAALELSLEAATHLEQQRADLDRLWQQRVERAAYEAERAGRQFRLVEPENRLVARHLEREWETKLAAHLGLEEEYRRFQETQPRGLSPVEREAIRQLAADIPALWQGPPPTPRAPQRVRRHGG